MKELLTIKDVAEALQMSPDWVYKAIRDGRLKSKEFGRYIRVTPQALQEYIESQPDRKIAGTSLSGDVRPSGRTRNVATRIQ